MTIAGVFVYTTGITMVSTGIRPHASGQHHPPHAYHRVRLYTGTVYGYPRSRQLGPDTIQIGPRCIHFDVVRLDPVNAILL